MCRLLIIGYGNPLRGDDGLGWHAVERLRSELTDPEIDIKAVHQLTPELSELMSRAGRVIFIDAAAEGEPGTLERRTLVPEPTSAAFTHQATPAGLLAAAEKLFGRAPEAELFSIPIESADFGYHLTPGVQQALNELVNAIVAIAREPQRP